jgi:hypothetical protein
MWLPSIVCVASRADLHCVSLCLYRVQLPNPSTVLYLHTLKISAYEGTVSRKHAFQIVSASKTYIYAADTKHEVMPRLSVCCCCASF